MNMLRRCRDKNSLTTEVWFDGRPSQFSIFFMLVTDRTLRFIVHSSGVLDEFISMDEVQCYSTAFYPRLGLLLLKIRMQCVLISCLVAIIVYILFRDSASE